MATHAENSIPGFRHAIACGADGLELDVAVSHDNVLIVTHDPVLRDGRAVRDYSAADLALPTLEEVLRIDAPEDFLFDIESKNAPADLLADIIFRSPRKKLILRSFDHNILRAFYHMCSTFPLAALIDFDSDEWVEIARGANAAIISPHFSTVTADRVARAHAEGVAISVWTVNQPEDWDRMAAWGVDAIITDDPAAGVRHFR